MSPSTNTQSVHIASNETLAVIPPIPPNSPNSPYLKNMTSTTVTLTSKHLTPNITLKLKK